MARTGYFRWWIALLLFTATGLSFFDRQVLSILAPVVVRDLHLDDIDYSRVLSVFIFSYTVMFTAGGRIIDRLGVRAGLAVSVGVWTLASLLHGAVRNVYELGFCRFLLGVGEGGCFPGATRGALEWFPEKERAAAVGFANGGSAFGALVAPPLTVWISLRWGWRGAFLATGIMGVLWLAAWLGFFRLPRESRFVTREELEYITEGCSANSVAEGNAAAQRPAAPPAILVPWSELLRRKEVWGLMITRFLLDPVFYFYMFWIPQYLAESRHIPLVVIGNLTWIPFLTLGLANVLGGWVSDRLVAAGWSINTARKTLLGLGAFLTPFSILCISVPGAGLAIALMSVLMLAHGFWIANYMTAIGDLFPTRTVGTVVGLSGSAGGVGGILSSLIVGVLAQHGAYSPLFVACGVLYPVGFSIILLTIKEIRPLEFTTH
jgi:ACS family hexuronate transporter-like MFS transporter